MYERDTAVTVFLGFRFGLNSTLIECSRKKLFSQRWCFMLWKVSLASFNLFSGGPMLNFHSLNRQSLEWDISLFVEPVVTVWLMNRKFALSTNFDGWFTYCVLSQQNSVSVEFVLWPFWLRKFSVWESKIAATPPPSFTTYTQNIQKLQYSEHQGVFPPPQFFPSRLDNNFRPKTAKTPFFILNFRGKNPSFSKHQKQL